MLGFPVFIARGVCANVGCGRAFERPAYQPDTTPRFCSEKCRQRKHKNVARAQATQRRIDTEREAWNTRPRRARGRRVRFGGRDDWQEGWSAETAAAHVRSDLERQPPSDQTSSCEGNAPAA